MWHTCIETPIDSVRSNPANDAFVCAESPALPRERGYLHATLLYDALHLLLVHMEPLLKELTMYSTVSVVLVLSTDALHLLN